MSDMTNYQTDHLTGEIETSLMDNRIITLTEEVNPSSAKTIIGKLLYLEAKSDDPIKLYISSPGGSVLDGLSIIDAMDLCKCDVETVGIGTCASMAAVILACGKKRKLYPNAYVMYHQISSMMYGKFQDLEVDYKFSKDLQDKIENIFITRTKLTKKNIDAFGSKDTWLSSKEALELGIIDEILKKK